MDLPKVSVIIPTYKRPTKLERAIDSVLNQTYPNVEIIVVDDNNDGDIFRKETELLMAKFTKKPNVIYLKHKVNLNGSAARNSGIIEAKGQYIAFLDDDDYFMPKKIENSVSIMENRGKGYGGICCSYVKKWEKYIYTKGGGMKEGKLSFELLSGEIDFAAGSTLMVKTSVFENIGMFDTSFERHQDWEFLIRFFRKYKLAINPEVDTVIQVDGIRNYPSSEKYKQIKEYFFSTFEDDLKQFSEDELKKINYFQWFDVGLVYLKEKKVKEGIQLIKNKVFVNALPNFMSLIKALGFFLNGFFPVVKKMYYIVMWLFFYRKFKL